MTIQDLKCNVCGDKIIQLGAILLSPPKDDVVIKQHICLSCFYSKLVPLLEHSNKFKKVVDVYSTKQLPIQNEALDHLKKVLDYAEKRTCTHEETYRGGSIWEICDSCGMKWADDEGGKPDNAHQFPKVLEDARSFLEKKKPTFQGITPTKETLGKMDKFDLLWYLRAQKGDLTESDILQMNEAIADHEGCGNWDVEQVLRSLKLTIEKPICPKCGTNNDMVFHNDGKWVCHRTHKLE